MSLKYLNSFIPFFITKHRSYEGDVYWVGGFGVGRNSFGTRTCTCCHIQVTEPWKVKNPGRLKFHCYVS